MLLNEIRKDPMGSYLYMERYVNLRHFFNPTLQGDLKQRYSPPSGDKTVSVKCLLLPRSVTSVETIADRELRNYFIREESVLFPVHPQLSDYETIEFSSLKRDCLV